MASTSRYAYMNAIVVLLPSNEGHNKRPPLGTIIEVKHLIDKNRWEYIQSGTPGWFWNKRHIQIL